MANPRFMLVLGALTLRGQVLLFETLRSLVDDICHVDVTGRVNIVNKAPEYCAVHPKWADGTLLLKTGFRGLRSTGTALSVEFMLARSIGIEPETQGNMLPLIRRRGCRGVRAVCRPG